MTYQRLLCSMYVVGSSKQTHDIGPQAKKKNWKEKNNSKFIERTEKHQVHHQDTAPWYSKVKSSSFAPRQQANFFRFKVVPLLSQVPTAPKARFFVLHAGDDYKSWKTDIILNIYIYICTYFCGCYFNLIFKDQIKHFQSPTAETEKT